eukprot:TRINITY_DN1028_c0_g1_i1.p1 TRINITY_DN1028_c0_g1~~TRINITY_DN1028_c0_g1_i1.p1  ORF type:complete len:319 (-),score=82.99 TRINITY_DN1028_c0_g1_i1:68-1024(-)
MHARYYLEPEQICDIYFNDIVDDDLQATTLRIKLIICSLGLNQPQSPIFNAIGKITGIAQLGTVHTAIQIGPCILDWNAQALVEFKPSWEYKSFKVLAVLDLGDIDRNKFIQDYMQPLAERISDWNIKSYGAFSTNCQAFTTDMLKILEMKLDEPTDTQIGHFIHNLQEIDHKDIPFKFTFQGNERTFNSHLELDIFCHDNEEYLKDKTNPQAQKDRRLLKAYDRVFWLRLYDAQSRPDDYKIIIPHQEPIRKADLIAKFKSYPADQVEIAGSPGEFRTREHTGCYFHDPGDTDTLYAKRADPEATLADGEEPGVNHF